MTSPSISGILSSSVLFSHRFYSCGGKHTHQHLLPESSWLSSPNWTPGKSIKTLGRLWSPQPGSPAHLWFHLCDQAMELGLGHVATPGARNGASPTQLQDSSGSRGRSQRKSGQSPEEGRMDTCQITKITDVHHTLPSTIPTSFN